MEKKNYKKIYKLMFSDFPNYDTIIKELTKIYKVHDNVNDDVLHRDLGEALSLFPDKILKESNFVLDTDSFVHYKYGQKCICGEHGEDSCGVVEIKLEETFLKVAPDFWGEIDEDYVKPFLYFMYLVIHPEILSKNRLYEVKRN